MSTGRPPLTWWTALMRGMLRHVLRWYEQDVAMTQSDGVISAEPRELAQLSTDALRAFRDRERARYEAIKTRATPFNLARGKPATEQVALADRLLTAVTTSAQCWAEDGNDCRNYYGSPQGLIEVRRLFAPMLGAPPEQVLVANNSSLALMHDALVYALLTGASDWPPTRRSRACGAFPNTATRPGKPIRPRQSRG